MATVEVTKWSVIIMVVIATAAFTMSACGGGDEPESTPTSVPPTATAEPFGQGFVREQVAKTISRVALEYGCRVDPADVDVSGDSGALFVGCFPHLGCHLAC